MNWDDYFWGLEARYREVLFDRTKQLLDNSANKGMLLHLIYLERETYLKCLQQMPFLKNLINIFEGALAFDKRRAVSGTLEHSAEIRRRVTAELRDGLYDDTDTHKLPMSMLVNGYEGRKLGYLPESIEEVLIKAEREAYIVKLLLRYYATKHFINTITPVIKAAEKVSEPNNSKQETERFHREVEILGEKQFPNLFGHHDAVNNEAAISSNDITDKKALTTAQQVLAIMLINRVSKICKSQEKKSMQDFIFALTNKNYREIGDKMKTIADNEFSPNTSPKQSKKDYEAVRPLFEKLEHKDVLDFIDKKISKLESMSN